MFSGALINSGGEPDHQNLFRLKELQESQLSTRYRKHFVKESDVRTSYDASAFQSSRSNMWLPEIQQIKHVAP